MQTRYQQLKASGSVKCPDMRTGKVVGSKRAVTIIYGNGPDVLPTDQVVSNDIIITVEHDNFETQDVQLEVLCVLNGLPRTPNTMSDVVWNRVREHISDWHRGQPLDHYLQDQNKVMGDIEHLHETLVSLAMVGFADSAIAKLETA